MKIAFLFAGFTNSGGVETIVRNFTNLLAENENNQIYAISYYKPSNTGFFTVNKKVKEYGLYTTSTTMTEALLCKGGINKLKKIIKKEQFDYLILCGALFYILGIRSTRKSKTKCVCWEHTHPSVRTDYRAQMLSRKYAIKKADEIVVLTKEARDYYINSLKANPNHVHHIYNFVTDDVFQSIKYDVQSKSILSIGRLSYPKNYELMIDVAEIVLKKYPKWTWDIYGSGSEEEHIDLKIKDKRLEGRINLKGEIKNIAAIISNYSFFVMTSRYEGFPMVLLEASANRLPLLSFDIPGPNEIIENGKNGYLIEPNNVIKMADAIMTLIENPKVRIHLSEEAYIKSQQFKPEIILSNWNKLLKL